MKKSLVAVGVIVALGVVWAGSSWYMGGKIESRIQEEKDVINTQLAQYAKNGQLGADVKVEIRDYKKGVFSSNANVVVLITQNDKADAAKNKTEEIIFKSDIDHGPFPLSDLARFNLMPKLAAMDNTLVKNASTETLFKYTQDKSPIDVHSSLGFNGGINTKFVVNNIDYKEEKEKVQFKLSPVTLDITSNKNGENISVALKGDGFSIFEDGKEQVAFKNISGSGDSSKLANGDYLFDNQNINFGEVTFVDSTPIVLKDLALTSKSELKDNLYNISQNYNFKNLSINGFDYGAGKFAYSIDKADYAAMMLITKSYNRNLLPWNTNQTDNAEILEKAVRDVLSKGLIFRIDDASLTNAQGVSKFNFTIDLNPFDEKILQDNKQKPADIFNTLFKNIDLNVNLSLPMLTEFRNTTQFMDATKYSDNKEPLTSDVKAEIEKSTQSEIELIKTELQRNINQVSMEEKDALPLMTLSADGKALDLKLNYAADKFTMNGKTYSFDEFMNVTQAPQMLSLAAMLLGASAYNDNSYSDDQDQEEVTEQSEIIIPETNSAE